MTTRIEPLRAGTLKRLIGSSPYFSRWEDQDYREAEPFVHLLSVAGGEVVMQMDDLPPYDYFLVNGAVELEPSSRDAVAEAPDGRSEITALNGIRLRVGMSENHIGGGSSVSDDVEAAHRRARGQHLEDEAFGRQHDRPRGRTWRLGVGLRGLHGSGS